MSARSFRSIQADPENWQSQLDYWIYLTEVFSGTPTPYPRGRASLSDDGWMGGANFGLESVPPAAALPSRPSVRFFHIDAYPGGRTPTPPAQYDWSRENESRLSQEDQKQAVNKLRKQFYNPHISNIIRRLGSSKSRSGDSGVSLQDEDGKRCAICLEDFESKQFVTVTPCNHMFHEHCIVPWVKSNGNCPVCRFVIAEQNVPRQRSSGSVATSRRGANPLRI